MRVGVITFPGSNCDKDTLYALERMPDVTAVPVWHKTKQLAELDAVFLPGGFSYGDYLRAGTIARFSPVMQAVQTFAEKGGKVIGICNGFQILTEAHLLPGVLRHNVNGRFICRNCTVKAEDRGKIDRFKLNARAFILPIAHAEGNFFAPPDVLERLEANGQVLFRYTDNSGTLLPEANPNGSMNNIAGICNEAGNVIGMMPHPERAADPLLGNIDGWEVLRHLLELEPIAVPA